MGLLNYSSPSSLMGGLLNRNRYASMAGIDSANQSDMAIGAQERKLTEMGVNPSAGRYAGLLGGMNIDAAANKAAAMTRAGNMVDERNLDTMKTVAGLMEQRRRDEIEQQMRDKQLGLQYAQLDQQNKQWRQGLIDKRNEDIAAANAMNLHLALQRGGLSAIHNRPANSW